MCCCPIRSCCGRSVERWQRELRETGRLVLTEGRPTIALETYIRLMVLKQRYRWGYRTLVAEVSDSIHLRRFCRIMLSERVPDESTVRKLTQADRRGDGVGADARADRQGDAGEAVPAAGGQDRLDGDRGRCELSDRRRAGVERGAGAGAGGSQAREADRREEGGGCGIARGRWGTSCGTITRTIRRRSGEAKSGGAEADRRDRRAAASARSRKRGGWPRSRGARRAGAERRRS